MLAGKKILRGSFALFSLGFVLAAAAFARTKTSGDSAEPTATVKRQSASAQFARAEEQQAALNSKPSEKRTLADYKQVVTSYRRVALITPRAPEVPDALLAVAELYTEMGDRFGRNYYQSAVDSYQFLLREYPKSKYCQDAMLRVAKLQRDQLADTALAKKTYEDFLKRYPRSARKREAQEALAELALLQNSDETVAKNSASDNSGLAKTAAADQPGESAPMHSGGTSVVRPGVTEIPRVRRIRAAANGDATRVTIDLENSVHFTSGRIANPDRIFFDLHAARLAPGVAGENVHVEGALLTAVRVAQNHAGVVRVVLDVTGVKDYAAVLNNNPAQLVINLYATSIPDPVRTANGKRAQKTATEDPSGSETATNSGARGTQTTSAKSSGDDPAPASEQPATPNGKGAIGAAIGSASAGSNSATSARNSLPSGKNARSKTLKAASAGAKPDLVQPADLCLDVALPLGKIIEQRLPGADVIYTRSVDTFIPLEERTNIANQAKADLFISIHANSSHDTGARGIETYYLNLKGSPEAMEVAARENATAQEGVHDLQNLVMKITQTEKIDESREFATDIQNSLSYRIQKVNRSVKNRGVRKAPFVVLIGAAMPSILTEISFLSNPADEKLLKQPEQRQKVAEGLYQGIASYLQNMNSVTVNLPAKKRAGQPGPGAPAAVEQSRNQR